MDFGRHVFSDPYFGWLCRGVAVTLGITVATTLLSLLLGVIVVAMRTGSRRTWRLVAAGYVNLFRNLPPVPLLLLLVFALPGVLRNLTGRALPTDLHWFLLIAGLSLNSSAYIAEILRSGLRGVSPRQWDAGRVLGLSPRATAVRVVYPQAVRIALPALGTRLIHNMKNSTMALVVPLSVGQMELAGQAARIAGQTFAWAEPLLCVAAVHLTMALLLGLLVNRLSRRALRKLEAAR